MKRKTIKAPNILLPKKGVDYRKYSVIACDQFTSQPDYWEKLKEEIGDSISTLHMIFPEAYLDKVNMSSYIEGINNRIDAYLNNSDLVDIGECFVLVERITSAGKRRLGLVLSIDLEDYTYQKGVSSLIRASEDTIIDRIPPRLKIRENAPIELPHILFLYNDPNRTITEDLFSKKDKLECLYDFDLIASGGHLRGYKVNDVDGIINKFYSLLNGEKDDLLFIVGDGNHSLATAKAHWDKIKTNLSLEERENHPARYALVEAVNIYDDGIEFEPIHRVIFNPKEDFIEKYLEVIQDKTSSKKGEIIANSPYNGEFLMPNSGPLAYKTTQDFIDEYLKNNPESSVDYIHDYKYVTDVCKKYEGSIGIIMPSLTKDEIFEYIRQDKVLSRKSFSLGHALDKRYYLEGKKIVK